MLRNAAVDVIATRLGNRTDLRDAIIAEMDLIMTTELDLSGVNYLWQIEQGEYLGRTIASEYRFNFAFSTPSLLALVEDTNLYFSVVGGSTEWQYLEYQDWLPPVDINTLALPTYWTWGSDMLIHFDTLIQGQIDLYGKCYRRATTVAGTYSDPTNNIDNTWLRNAPDVVIAATAERMAQNIVAPELAQMFANQKTTALDRIYRQDIAKREAHADRASTDD